VTLVTVKTRVPASVAAKLSRLAKQRDRSVAAELRQAIIQHLNGTEGKR
jgi:predicted transcriptional regulator